MAAGLLELRAGASQLFLAPALGGGIAALDWHSRPVLRRWSGKPAEGPFALACNILVPFSNRIAGGGFAYAGKRYDIEPNLPGEACPIHGDGFQRDWRVDQTSDTSATLVLDDGHIGPWRYQAVQAFELTENSLMLKLQLTNSGEVSLPFGFGVHPWFPRDADTRLAFGARGVWLEDSAYLPTQHVSLDEVPQWDFGKPRPLPDHWINNAFTGWSGTAEIEQGSAFVSAKITVSENLNCAIVHSVDENCNFLCFEPVSHTVDAMNQPGTPGMVVLKPGESVQSWMNLDWNRHD